jgi:hypothetical protein
MVPPCSDRVSRAPPYSRIYQNTTPTGLSPAAASLSRLFGFFLTDHWPGPRSLATTRESLLMSFPPGTEMFQFPGFASQPYVFRLGYPKGVGFPIRTSADQRSLASPRGFSQRATSFIASWRQGIHRMPFSHSVSTPPPAHRAKPRPMQLLPLSGGSARSIPRARSRLAPNDVRHSHTQQLIIFTM